MGWHTTKADYPPEVNLRIKNVDPQDSNTLVEHKYDLNANACRLQPYEFSFTTPDDIEHDTPLTICFECSSKTKLVIADLFVMPVTISAMLAEDVNHDGTVDTQDVLCIYNFMQGDDGTGNQKQFDVNDDGIIDTQDVLRIYEYMQLH
mgnify:CR=1 FL=1